MLDTVRHVVVGRSAEERLCQLLLGADTHHGTYDAGAVAPAVEGHKVEIKPHAKTVMTGGATPDLWRLHISAERPLGVVPIREDGTCLWGAIDVDDRQIHLDEARRRVEAAELPLVLCRSKSGGAHLYLFLSEPADAADVRRALGAMAARLGWPGTEIFPKQEAIDPASDRWGNWLNMPYFGGDQTDRYCVKPGGLEMTVGEFLDYAEKRRVAPDALKAIAAAPPPRGASRPARAPAASQEAGAAHAGRELARFAAEISVRAEGGRNKLVFGRARDMGRMVGAGWIAEDEVWRSLLAAATACGLPFSEATDTVRNGLARGVGEEPPEVGSDRTRPRIERMVVTEGGDEVMWSLDLAGVGSIVLPVKEVMDFRLFAVRCAERLHVAFMPMKAGEWIEQINPVLETAEVLQVAPDETPVAQLREALNDFLTNRYRGEKIEDLLAGNPVLIDDDGRYYFRFRDLMSYLDRRDSRFRSWSRQRIGVLMREALGEDLGKTTKKLKGKLEEVRWVRASVFEAPGPLSLPAVPVGPI